jgi:hypothetical protein
VNAVASVKRRQGPRDRLRAKPDADTEHARRARVVAELVETGGIVVIGTDAQGCDQYGWAPAGLARMRADLVADGVDPENETARAAWLAGLFA